MEKKALLIILSFLIVGTCMVTPRVHASVWVTIAAGSTNDYVYVYDEAGNLLWNYNTGADVASVAVSLDGVHIAVGSLQNKLYLFDRSGTKKWEKPVPVSDGGMGWWEPESKSVQISALGEYVVAGCTDRLYVYNMDGTLHWSHVGKETCVDISPNGNYIVSCNSGDGTVHFFSIAKSAPLWNKSIGAHWVATSDAGYVAAASRSTIYLYDILGTQIWSYSHSKWDTDYIRVDMPLNGFGVVAVNDDPADNLGCVLCYWNDFKDGTPGWNSADGAPVWTFVPSPDVGGNDFSSVAISGGGEYIATGPSQGSVVFHASSNVSLQTFSMGSGLSYDLTFDGQFGACGNREGTLWYFSKDSSTPLWSKTIGGWIQTVALAQYIPSPYDVTIRAHCNIVGADVSVSIAMDGSPTGYTTPHTFTGLTGTHTFTVPGTDPHAHPFKQWSTGETSSTITVNSAGTYTALYEYEAPPVGGVWVPVDTLGLLAPYIGLASTILVATATTAIYVKRFRRKEEKR